MLKFSYKQVLVSIANIMQKIKYFLESDKGKSLITVIIVVLVGIGSFGLGRLSKSQENKGIDILYRDINSFIPTNSPDKPNLSSNSLNSVDTGKSPSKPENSSKKGFVASRIGSRYYPLDCPAGDKLKQENKIYFSTEKEAIEKGYTKSSSCK
ncbi:MAG: Ada Zn binding protein [Patescibacteria group bacterium]|nr:Ada Zn binding protein [Patescibacteria group bacterium]